jgi:ubiquinone biosynthesis protein
VRIAAVALVRVPVLLIVALIAALAFVGASVSVPSARPRILRWFFEQANGGAVKIGQLLASRFDLLPAAYCEELGSLLDSLRPVPSDRIRRIVHRSLGRPVDNLFEYFDDTPIGTASLAQVHAATLFDGQEVVVKVLKPGIRQLMTVDMVVFELAANALSLIPFIADLEIVRAARQLRKQAVAELDLEREAVSLAFFSKAMAADDLPHYAPRPYRRLCSADVLTMERIRGVSVREILSAVHRDDQQQLKQWAQRGITPERVARLLFRSVLEQSVRYRMFNSDPHPSNLIIGESGVLNWVDFGLVGWLDEKQWSLQLRLRQAFLRSEVHLAYTLFVESAGPFERHDLREFQADMKEAIRAYVVAARDLDAPITQRSTGAFLIKTLSLLRRNRLPVSTEIIPLYRAILIADIVMLRLDPTVDWLAEMRDFFGEFLAEQVEHAVRATVDDPTLLAALSRIPSTILAGLDWLDRRSLLDAAPANERRSAADELITTGVHLLSVAAIVGFLWVLAIALGLLQPFAGPVQWVADNRLVAVVLAAVATFAIQRWSRRFRR